MVMKGRLLSGNADIRLADRQAGVERGIQPGLPETASIPRIAPMYLELSVRSF
jgi:hypothetical protein